MLDFLEWRSIEPYMTMLSNFFLTQCISKRSRLFGSLIMEGSRDPVGLIKVPEIVGIDHQC